MLTLESVSASVQPAQRRLPTAGALVELLKPVTWFPPMWAFSCGVVSAGVPMTSELWWKFALGIALTGPVTCASSQAVNDWFDRHVDAINEPGRPIPSGRMPGRWGLAVAIAWSALALAIGALFGPVGLTATAVAVAFSWAYSAPPLRLKANGWFGNAAVGITYEGLAWITGAVIMLGGAVPRWEVLALAALYSLGAHGIMTLNDFKAIEGDRQSGVRSLPVQLGPDRAARLAGWTIVAPQFVVVALLLWWGRPWHALAIALLITQQLRMLPVFFRQPVEKAFWYSGMGVPFSVLGMMVCAHAVRGLEALR
ncbi:MAG: chlorophyll synthase ChlG [Gemmatimonadaceae bacterium]|nr:chlorophyll synthase ChlG [Gemmatimonadaceae bacterium]